MMVSFRKAALSISKDPILFQNESINHVKRSQRLVIGKCGLHSNNYLKEEKQKKAEI